MANAPDCSVPDSLNCRIIGSMKTCYRCGETLPRSSFSRDKSRPDGLFTRCRQCDARRYQANRAEIDARNAAYAAAHAREIAAYQAAYYATHKQRLSKRAAEYRVAHGAEIAARGAEYRAANIDKIKANLLANRERTAATHAAYTRKRRAADVQFRLGCALRTRLSQAVRGQKAGSAVRDLGCSLDDLKRRLERLWQPGMSWANYGCKPGDWSLDHIRPLASFDLTDAAQVAAACHFSNLQPLWHVDNIRKGASLAA